MIIEDFKKAINVLNNMDCLKDKAILLCGENTQEFEDVLKNNHINEGDWDEIHRGNYSVNMYLLNKKNVGNFSVELDNVFVDHFVIRFDCE